MCNEVIPHIYDNYFQNLEGEKGYLSETENIDYLNAIERLRENKDNHKNFINAEPVSNPVKSIFAVIIAFAVSTTLTISKKWHHNELQKKELVKDHFETELMFLKSQVNPHFLFNTLNSIYSMAVKKSDKTADTIVKLSSLIRYMLYDSNNDLVELEEELMYIRNYIELQSIRLHDDVSLQFQIEGRAEGKLIAPMLLVPLIENAFKHGIDYTVKSYVYINITVVNDELSLRIKNSKNKQNTEQADKNSGIGLKNVKRRLELVYPDRHVLDINESDDLYDVSLTLNLSDNEMPDS
jgi:LytS/YehU family sensor histidine kinase